MMFVFDIDRRQTFFFVIWKTWTPQQEQVKYYFSGHKQKHVTSRSVTTSDLLAKVARLCSRIATFRYPVTPKNKLPSHKCFNQNEIEFTAQAAIRVANVFFPITQSLIRMMKSNPQPIKFEIPTLFNMGGRNLTIWPGFQSVCSDALETLKEWYKLQVCGNRMFVLQT